MKILGNTENQGRVDSTPFIILKVSPNHSRNDVGVPHIMINKIVYQIFDSRFCRDMPARYVLTTAFSYTNRAIYLGSKSVK